MSLLANTNNHNQRSKRKKKKTPHNISRRLRYISQPSGVILHCAVAAAAPDVMLSFREFLFHKCDLLQIVKIAPITENPIIMSFPGGTVGAIFVLFGGSYLGQCSDALASLMPPARKPPSQRIAHWERTFTIHVHY